MAGVLNACGQALLHVLVLLHISWCALVEEHVCDFSHTISKMYKIAWLANFEFKNMFLLNVISKNESRQLYSTSAPYFNFEFCEAANPEWLSVLMGHLKNFIIF